MINICYCLHNPGVGGAERHLLQVFELLDRKRFHPILTCLGNGRDGPLYQPYCDLGVEVISLGMNGGGMLRPHSLSALMKFIRLIRRRRIQIIHGYLFEGNLMGAMAGRLARVPVVITSKRSLDHYGFLEEIACRFSNMLSTKITANAEAVRDYAAENEHCPGSKFVVIPNGVIPREHRSCASPDPRGLKRSWGIPPYAPVVGTVARFFWKKGYRFFLEAAEKVLHEFPDVRFVSIGDGPLREPMEAKARDLGIRDRVLFMGWRENPTTLLNGFDIYFCASLIEGASNALLEAMAAGLPVVSTDVGGNREVITQGKTGLLVPSGDPQAMAGAIFRLLEHGALRKEMGSAGRERVFTHFTSHQMVRSMENLYDKLLQQKIPSRKIAGSHPRSVCDRQPGYRGYGKATPPSSQVSQP